MITIRIGEKKDMRRVLELIQELADFEKAGNEVETSVEILEEDGFGNNPIFEIFVAEADNKIIGFALFYTKYSTWKGKCIYLEDLMVSEQHRRSGVGAQLFEAVIAISKKRKVKRMEWQVLDWNEIGINFYKKYNTNFDGEWFNCKLVDHQF